MKPFLNMFFLNDSVSPVDDGTDAVETDREGDDAGDVVDVC